MAEALRTNGPASALTGLAEELAAGGFGNARHVGKGGAGVGMPTPSGSYGATHEGPIATVEALNFS